MASLTRHLEQQRTDLTFQLETAKDENERLNTKLKEQSDSHQSTGFNVEELTAQVSQLKKKLKEREKQLKLLMDNIEETEVYKTIRRVNEDLILELKDTKAEIDRLRAQVEKLLKTHEKMIHFAMNEGLHLPSSFDT